METLLKRLFTDKGTKSYRTALLVVCLYVADKVTDLDKRVAVLESRASRAIVASVTDQANAKANVGPEWPKTISPPVHR